MERVAVIQFDYSNLKFMLLEVEGAYFRICDEIDENLSLGSDITKNGLISVVNLTSALKILKMFRKLCDRNNVTKSFSVATEIFKHAKNEKSFFEEIYNNTGFNFQILSVDEQTRAIYSGIINVMDCPKGVLFNVDNNNTTIVYYNRRNCLKSFVLNIGALTLAEKFESDKTSNKEKYDKMVTFVKSELKKLIGNEQLDLKTSFIGGGNSFLNLGRLARKATHYPLELENNYVVSSQTMSSVYDFVLNLDLDKTMKLKGISSERADMLASGICIIKALFETYNIETLSVSSSGFKQGVIFNYVIPEVLDKPLSEMMGYSLESIKKMYEGNNNNINQVYALTLILFKQIKVLHKLSRAYVKPLKIAATLFESGKRICFENNSKISFDVILNSKIYGVSHKELLIAAFAALCQNPDDLNLSDWIRYKDILSEEDLDAVRKIGMIIKLADALDKSKNSVVEDINCDILGDSVILKTVVAGDASFEIMLANKIAPAFKKIFKKNLQVI